MGNKIIAYIFAFACLVSAISFKSKLHKARNENHRITANYETLNSDLQFYKTKSGAEASRADLLQYTVNELKKEKKLVEAIKDLKIKASKVVQYSETVTNNKTTVYAVLQDSIIYDTIPLKALNYKDSWTKIFAIIQPNDSINLSIQTRDSITQVIYKGQRIRPTLWIFSKRKLQQSITSSNPNSKIEYQKTIQVQKKY